MTGTPTAGDVAEEFIRLADGDDLPGRKLPGRKLLGRKLSVTEQYCEVGHWGLPKNVRLSLSAPVGPGGVPGEPGALPDSDLPRVAARVKAFRVLMASRMTVARMAMARMAARARNGLLAQGRDIPEAV